MTSGRDGRQREGAAAHRWSDRNLDGAPEDVPRTHVWIRNGSEESLHVGHLKEAGGGEWEATTEDNSDEKGYSHGPWSLVIRRHMMRHSGSLSKHQMYAVVTRVSTSYLSELLTVAPRAVLEPRGGWRRRRSGVRPCRSSAHPFRPIRSALSLEFGRTAPHPSTRVAMPPRLTALTVTAGPAGCYGPAPAPDRAGWAHITGHWTRAPQRPERLLCRASRAMRSPGVTNVPGSRSAGSPGRCRSSGGTSVTDYR